MPHKVSDVPEVALFGKQSHSATKRTTTRKDRDRSPVGKIEEDLDREQQAFVAAKKAEEDLDREQRAFVAAQKSSQERVSSPPLMTQKTKQLDEDPSKNAAVLLGKNFEISTPRPARGSTAPPWAVASQVVQRKVEERKSKEEGSLASLVMAAMKARKSSRSGT
eukprot:GSA25T00006239001.1